MENNKPSGRSPEPGEAGEKKADTLGNLGHRGARRRFAWSFKNRILINTLLVLIGGVVTIAAILQIAVFPRLKGDPAVIGNLKTIHLVASVVVVVISWGFIEVLSKKITLPLQELTKHADQISKDVGRNLSPKPFARLAHSGDQTEEDALRFAQGDEIRQLKTSFYRMLAHINASESRLRESEERYRFLFNDGPFPLFVLNVRHLAILDVNARAEQQYQYNREELMGKSFLDLGVPVDREQTGKIFKDLVANRISDLPVIQQKCKDGSVFMANVQARVSWFKDLPAIIAAVWDVTEKLEREAMMVQTAKMVTLGEMATGIAHELNQPLNVIKIGSDFLLKSVKKGRPVANEELLQTAEQLGKNVDRAALIIGHLREFGRKAESTMNPITVNKPIRGAFTMLGTQLEKTGILCELSLVEDLPPIMGDANRLEQVFINLIINARDAMVQQERDSGPGKKTEKILTIRSFPEDDRVVVTVSDTGPGVPQELRSRIFEPFFTTKKVGEGTGIGLSVSYGIVKEHQGTIRVRGRGGKGATFRLTFPALEKYVETKHG